LSYNTFSNLFDELQLFWQQDESCKCKHGSWPQMPLKLQLMVFLYHMGHLADTVSVASTFGISVGEVVFVCDRMASLINTHLSHKYIKWPDAAERDMLAQLEKTEGQNQGQFAGVIGALDGSHIELAVNMIPHINQKDYVN